jgi:ABC-type glycerol-3-phosphate transport system permease component
MRTRYIASKILLYFLIALVAAILLVPMVMLFSYAMRDSSEIITVDVRFFPKHWTLSAFTNAFNRNWNGLSFIGSTFNSVFVCGLSAVISTYIAALGGYGFIRYNFWGKKILFFCIFFTQIMPWIVLLVPYYTILVNVKMLDTLVGLGFSYLVINVPVSAWLFIGFFRDQPASLEEAARIDGCTVLGVFHRIVLPLAAPGLSAILLFAFITGWGDFLFSSVLVSTAGNITLPLFLQSFKGDHYIDWATIMAVSVFMTVPIAVLFLVLQKQMVNLMAGSIKE